MLEQQTHSRLEITDINHEIKGRLIHVAYVDGRDNSQTRTYLLKDLYKWLNSELNIPYQNGRQFAHRYLTTEHIKRFIQDSKTIEL